MAKLHDGNFSEFVSKTLNNMGYSWQTICRRRDFFKDEERHINNTVIVGTGWSMISAGSRREGVCKFMGSDNDIMFVFNEVVCREDFRDLESRRDLTFFEIDFHGCPPGYAHLVLVKHGGRIYMGEYTNESARLYLQKIIEDSCCGSESGKLYLNSDKFVRICANIWQDRLTDNDHGYSDSVIAGLTVTLPRAGPSLPRGMRGVLLESGSISFDSFETSVDRVPSFPCHCPSLFEKFRNRPRRHGWPSPDLLQELSQLDAHAVAVGDKMSEDHFMQWRICFTQAEIRLIESLTEPQIHVFVLLKIFAKEVLKKTWDKMTSYVVKNVLLWMAELTPARKFRTDTIVERFLDCLFFLKICVKAGFLPNYMISERNLLRHERFIVKRKQLLSLLEDCLYEKSSCLYKSDTLKEALLKMYSRPEVVLQHGIERDRTEQAFLSMWERIFSEGQDVSEWTMQDWQRFCLSGNASEIVKLIFKEISDEEALRDPAACIQELLHKFYSHLK